MQTYKSIQLLKIYQQLKEEKDLNPEDTKKESTKRKGAWNEKDFKEVKTVLI
jgi:hypothetical protein